MTRDMGIIEKFVLRAVSKMTTVKLDLPDDEPNMYLVALRYDGQSTMFSTAAELVLVEVTKIKLDSGPYYRWQKFDTESEADMFMKRLANIDSSTTIPLSPDVVKAQR